MAADPVRGEGYAHRIVATIHEPLLVLDRDFRVRQANPSFCRTFGIDREGTVGESLFELSDGQWDRPALGRQLVRVRDEGEAFEGVEMEATFPGVGRRIMRLNGRVLERSDGDSREILLAIDDVTEERELEAELRRKARELKASNQDLEQFAYAASHDLQEPIRMVSSYLELLERRYRDDLDEEAREFIDYAVDGARRMKSLINGLLEYSRVGRKESSFGEIDLDAVLDEVLEDLAGQISGAGAEVKRTPLPSCYGNRDQLRRVLQNLIENALTYHGDGPPRIRVRGEALEEGGARLAVEDDGPGIPPEAREKVFQIFHQLDAHGVGREGSGMGLALCRKIVERHGGEIEATSEPGEGTTIHFTIQLQPEEIS